MGKPTIVLDTMVIKELAFKNGPMQKPFLPYDETLIEMREAGYHIAIADIAVLELGDLLRIEMDPQNPTYFNLDSLLDTVEKFISPVTPFWPGRTEIRNRGDIKPRKNKTWQGITQKQWTAFFSGLRERSFHARKMFHNGEEIEIGVMMNKAAEIKDTERKIWSDHIELLAKWHGKSPFDKQIKNMQDICRRAHPHIKNAHKRLDLRIHRMVYMANELMSKKRSLFKNDAMDNHLDFSHFYPVVVITNDNAYRNSCLASGSEQAANVRTTDQMVSEFKSDKGIYMR